VFFRDTRFVSELPAEDEKLLEGLLRGHAVDQRRLQDRG